MPLKWNWHLDVICEECERITLGQNKRLVLNAPPRSLKSTIIGVCWPAWTWIRTDLAALSGPHVQFFFISYEQGVSEKDAKKCKNLIRSQWYQEQWGDRYSLLNDAAWKFDNSAGGYRIASSIGGPITAHGGAILVVDDLISSKGADSQLALDTANQVMEETVPTRLNDPINGAIVVNMQRMHENDPVGHMIETGEIRKWRWLMLPMEFDPDRADPADQRTERGEILDPNRWDDAILDTLKKSRYAYDTQYQQLGRPRKGNVIEEGWWQMWPPARICPNDRSCTCAAHLNYPPFSFVVGSMDTNYGEGEQNDFAAFTKWGIWWEGGEAGLGGRPRLLMVQAWRVKLPLLGPKSRDVQRDPMERLAPTGLVEKVYQSCAEAGMLNVDALLIENKTRGGDVEAELRKLLQPGQFAIHLVDPVGSKIERLHAVSPMFTDELVYAPNTQWAQMVINETLSFPRGKNDDLVDTVSQCLSWLRKLGIMFMTGETDPEAPAPDYGGEKRVPYDL